MTPILAMNPGTAQPYAAFAKKTSAAGTQSTQEKHSAAKAQSALAAAKEPPKLQNSKNKNLKNSIKPAMDEYLPEEKQEPSGRYWIKADANGHSKIYFDNPEPASSPDGKPEAVPQSDAKPDAIPQSDTKPGVTPQSDAPDKPSGTDTPDTDNINADTPNTNHPKTDGSDKKNDTDKMTGNTDKVDREIRKLKQKKKQLEQQCNSETDEEKIKDLKKELSKVENELRQKDNDSYRRRNTVFS